MVGDHLPKLIIRRILNKIVNKKNAKRAMTAKKS